MSKYRIPYGHRDKLGKARYGREGPTTDVEPPPEREIPDLAPAPGPPAREPFACRCCGERPHLPHLAYCAECL